MSVKKAMQEIDDQEFGYWLAYYKLNPFDKKRDDINFGTLKYLLACINTPSNKARPKLDDFILDFEKEEKSPYEKGMALKMMMTNKAKHYNQKYGDSRLT